MKLMTVRITQEDYDWMMNFITSEEPDFDAPEMFASIIESAGFEDLEEKK